MIFLSESLKGILFIFSMVDIHSLLIVVFGLALFEIIPIIDNAIIKAIFLV